MIELVIKLKEAEYDRIVKSNKTIFADATSKEAMMYAIKNGIPLPKGHGCLIDADSYHTDIKNHYFDDATVIRCTEIGLNNAPTIIEADKEE